MQENTKPLYGLVHRMVPWLQDAVQFHLVPHKENEADHFELITKKSILHISATSLPAAGMGLNHYLKYFCHRSSSHCGDNLAPVTPLPEVKEKVIRSTPFQYRYALNYCTYNYTMSFWKWEQWEKELDWMLLHSVNLMLVATGTKAVWKKVLEKLDYAPVEINNFLPGPVYNAWWLMGNLEGWGGTASEKFIDQQVALTRKILSRMKEYGIEPVYHGFYGMVPRSFAGKFPEAAIIEQGKWNNAFLRPEILVCTSPLFTKTARIYYDVVKKLFGDFKFFGGDPFHEGGSTDHLDVGSEAAAIYDAMQQAVPGSIWVLQAWYGNPKQALLDGIKNKEHLLILDLFGEVTNEWREREAFSGTPFIWCSINNFGEKTGMHGRLDRIAAGPAEALQSKYHPYLKGIGAIPEGIANNPVVFDLIFESAWNPENFDVKKWLPHYTRYRYGKTNDNIIRAWEMLHQTVYASPDHYQEGASEPVFCARPSLHIKSVSTWATRRLHYDTCLMQKAARLILSTDPELTSKATYQYDLVDMVRQIIANEGQHVYDKLIKAYQHRHVKTFEDLKDDFLKLILLQDELLSSYPAFMLGRWIKEARQFRKSREEKELCEWNARVLITYWGPDDPNTSLRDYAHKEWSGLLRDYYYPRWKFFLESLSWELQGLHTPEIHYFSFEKNWAMQKKTYPSTPKKDAVRAVATALDKLEKIQNGNAKIIYH